MKSKFLIISALILIIGVVFRLFLTADGSFLFNMDNARDFVDIREMVELHKLRLTGPTSAIEGLYTGPLWYYILAIPYILMKGDPYGAILTQILFWVIGGIALLKLTSIIGKWLIIPVGLVWVGSNYIVLANLYSFNPNPVTLLSPALIFTIYKFIKTKRWIWIVLSWILAGAFFNFEMNFGVWTPLIIFFSLFLIDKKLLLRKSFFLGVSLSFLFVVPQILFDLKHNYIMSKGILKFLSEEKGSGFNPIKRILPMYESFYNVFVATLMNQKLLSQVLLILAVPAMKVFFSKNEKNIIARIALLYILIPYVGYLLIQVTVNPWHLGGPASASLIVIAFILKSLWDLNPIGKFSALTLSFFLILYPIINIGNYFINDRSKPNLDPSLYKNEISAIDYVYKVANGKNFKVYTYLPSVYDYPYQYLFWWYGQKKYGYIPGEYVYSPNKPQYIPSQDKFSGRKDNLSDLIFLIKEPDRIQMRVAWENDYKNTQLLQKETLGNIEVEVRKQLAP